MLMARISGATRTLGVSQGYNALHIRDQTLDFDDGQSYPAMVSAWEPTPEELARLVAGAKIELLILGTGHPPVKLMVGDVPE